MLSSIPLADSLAAALPDGWGNEAAHLAGNGAGTLYLRERILQLADRDRLNTSWIRGGSSGVLILAEFPAENESKEDIVIHWLYAVNFTAPSRSFTSGKRTGLPQDVDRKRAAECRERCGE